MAQQIADHLNRKIAKNPAEIQQYMFASIANELGMPVDVVRSAISDGGHNGITLGVREDERQALARYLLP